MDLSWTVDRAGDASLVRCRVRNEEAVPRRVRVESRFEAPVLPPRRGGVPADGWDATGVTLRVDPGDRRGFGFAVPAPPVDPPVEIVDVEAADPDESARATAGPDGIDGGGDATPADALRDLADHRPPRAAVDGDRETADRPEKTAPGVEAGGTDGEGEDTGGDAGGSGRAASASVDDWFAAVEARIDRAERLTDADVATATEVVADAGGIDALAGVDDRIDGDADRLRAVSERAASLAERAAETDVPVDALERLA
ncbi:hypothetical protein DJ82_08880 [Halorubrum sp. Ib24]|uniref:DUF7857 domain-containing protein n=1 Tax=unclassified Halorubrum TaxID=2642239 RepID=UPI000B97E196|nr:MULTISPECIES: hypothetical protein [unclassified Halorubrum]OYR39805.1 hypothetical protein DJ82_08880 [Halorubrum sp. Ib24]OYR49745.1 hypothetical protein DJ74_08075 [Halorubrum sp. Ea8]OYR55384.1 hypothetical protein DJ73_02355 [Halorubrum sp. Ea1]